MTNDNDEMLNANDTVQQDDKRSACPCNDEITGATCICCDNCSQWYHLGCVNLVGLSQDAVTTLTDWRCPRCYLSPYTPQSFLRAALSGTDTTELSHDVNQIVSDAVNDALQKFTGEAKTLIENTTKATYASTLKEGLKEAIDKRTTTATAKKVVIQFTADTAARAKREANVVVSGVKESLDAKQSKRDDLEFLTQTCKIDKRDIVDHFRAGKVVTTTTSESRSPRPLVVKLKDSETANHCCDHGKGVRVKGPDSENAVHWINPDLCAADREAQFFLRQERRKRFAAKMEERQKREKMTSL